LISLGLWLFAEFEEKENTNKSLDSLQGTKQFASETPTNLCRTSRCAIKCVWVFNGFLGSISKTQWHSIDDYFTEFKMNKSFVLS